MRTILYLICSSLFLVAFAFKLADLKSDRSNIPLRFYCATLGLIAACFATGSPLLRGFLESSTGILAMWDGIFIVAATSTVQAGVYLWTYPVDEAWRRLRPRWVLHGAVALTVIALSVAGRVDTGSTDFASNRDNPEILYGAVPQASLAVVVYSCFQIYVTVEAAIHYHNFARTVDVAWARRGLRLASICALCFTGFALSVASYFIGALMGRPLEAALGISVLMVIAGGFVSAAASVAPVIGPVFDRASLYRRLGPLWSDLVNANPEVRLHRHRRIFEGVEARLYRRYIEICDSRLKLLPYRNLSMIEEAKQRAAAAGLAGASLRATAEAAALASAMRAKKLGQTANSPAERLDQEGAFETLDDEVAWLTEVAYAYRGTIVSGIMAEQNAVPSSRS